MTVLGFAAAYALAAGSRAATAVTTTTPNPDPPPTTTVVQPQPPPPPPPAQTYAPPPPPPPVQSPRKLVKRRDVAPSRPKAHTRLHSQPLPTKVSRRRPPGPPVLTRRAALTTSTGRAATGASAYLELLLGVALGMLVLIAGVALAPVGALPQPVADRIDGRREVLVSASAAVAAGIAIGLVVALS